MIYINPTTFFKLGKFSNDEKFSNTHQNGNMDIIDTELKRLQDSDESKTDKSVTDNHLKNKDNPHKVTKEQLGLSNVVNRKQIYGISSPVTTGGVPVFDGNGYTVKDSGFKIEKSVPANAVFTDTVYTHPSGTNPHGTTKTDVGLGKVPNVETDNQSPTFTEASDLTSLISGDKLSISFGKIALLISSFISHITNHIKPDNKTIRMETDGTISGYGFYTYRIEENGADLNDPLYCSPGRYACPLIDTARTLLNCPTEQAFSMDVLFAAGQPGQSCTQILTEYMHEKPKRYIRNIYISSTVTLIGEWGRIYSTFDPPPTTNDLISTESGTALDAVQGKILQEKINKNSVAITELNNKISQLMNNITKK